MKERNATLISIALGMCFAFCVLGNETAPPARAQAASGKRAQNETIADSLFKELPRPGKKCWIDEGTYFTYKFTKKPKLGTAILKVQVFDKKGKKLTRLMITGDSGMPSMRGAHDSREVPFKLNKKGDYLLPVDIVMPGEWQVKLTFYSDGKTVYRGRFKFAV